MKIHLILENIRNKYRLGLLEESENFSEKEILESKILLTEATMSIRHYLVEEGTIEAVKSNLKEAFEEAIDLSNPKTREKYIRRASKAVANKPYDRKKLFKSGAAIGAIAGSSIANPLMTPTHAFTGAVELSPLALATSAKGLAGVAVGANAALSAAAPTVTYTPHIAQAIAAGHSIPAVTAGLVGKTLFGAAAGGAAGALASQAVPLISRKINANKASHSITKRIQQDDSSFNGRKIIAKKINDHSLSKQFDNDMTSFGLK